MRILLVLLLTFITTIVFAQPVISSFSPQSGAIGATVTINGSGLSSTAANNIVYFGAVKATVSAASANSLTVTVPAGATFQPISVTVNNLTGYSSVPFKTTFTPAGTGFNSASFDPKAEFSTHNNPMNIVTADFDGDGKPDAAVPNSGNQSISVLRNTSTPGTVSFAQQQFFGCKADFHLCTADFNGDGLIDIAAVGGSGSDIAVLRNTSTAGNISFATFQAIGTGTWTNSVAAADIDADGKPDLIVVNQFANTFSVLRNTSSGGTISFTSVINVSTGGLPNYAATGDFDGDSKIDVAVTYGSKVSIYKNLSAAAGNFSFAARIDLTANADAWGLSVGDLDDDGKLDIASAYTTSNLVSVFRNTTAAAGITFAAKTDLSGVSGYSVTIGDIDGDGKPDIASGRTGILKNNSTSGSLSFSAVASYTTIATNNVICGLSICDLDLDGKPDVSVAGSGAGVFAVLHNRIGVPGIVSFSPTNAAPGQTVTISGSYFNGATAVNFAGVPANSFTVVNASTITAVVPGVVSGNISVTSALGTGSLGLFYNGPTITSFTPTSGVVGSSITITGSAFNTVAANNIVYFGAVRATVTNATSTSLTVTVPAGATNQPISVTAYNLSAFTAQPFNVTFAGGGTPFVSQSFYTRVDSSVAAGPANIVAGDIDGDGKADIISINKTAGSISVLRNTSFFESTSFTAKQNFSTTSTPLKGTVADVDGDGKLDVIVVSASVISIFRNMSTTGNISFAARVDINYPGYSGAIAIADMNKDGRPDLVVSNCCAYVLVFKNTSSGVGSVSFDAPVSFGSDGSPVGIAIGDLNADGKTDIAITNDNPSSISVFKNTTVSGVLSFAITTFSANYNSSGIAINDLNADGKPEIAVITNSFVSIFRNTTTSTSFITLDARVDYTVFDQATSIAIGDLDGDGKPEVVAGSATVPSVAVIRNTSTAGAAFTATSFAAQEIYTAGANTIAITTADIDGDGRADIATANSTDNTISILRNVVGKFPTLTSFNPTIAGIGDNINLIGTNFTNANPVMFGAATAASFTVNSPTSITAVTGLGATGNVSVITPNGTASLSGFTSTAPPFVSSFTPTSGNSLWTNVTIAGLNFGNATGVSFGGIAADTFIIATPTTIRAVVGAGGASGNVTVTSPNGSGSKAGFNYIAVPLITSFTPESGAIGSTVTITGSNFSAAASDNVVFFGAVKATVLSASTTTLTVKVPVGASYYPISVTNSSKLIAYSKKPFIATFPGSDAFTNTSFDTATSYTTQGQNYDVAVSDMDGDGKPDMVILCGADLNIYRNISNGGSLSFAARIVVSGGAIGQGRIHVTDLDGDGKQDVALTRGNNNEAIAVLRNTSTPGNISFAERQHFITAPLPWCIYSGDLDGDGKPELVTGQGNYNTISILKNTSTSGSISFAANVDYNIGQIANDIKIADVDGDKKPDLLVAVDYNSTWPDGHIYIYQNRSFNGLIALGPKWDIMPGYAPITFAVGDIDGDGKPDIATANSNGMISLLRNTTINGSGNISFAPRIDSSYSSATRGITMADFNGDGKPDIAVADYFNSRIAIFKNTSLPGTISVAARKEYAVGSYYYNPAYNIAVGDLDADGKLDIVNTNKSNGITDYVSVLRNRIGEPTSTSICVGGGTNLTSNITGTSYQWQINRGSGFVNLTDSTTYFGSNSVTLQLSNLPSAWYGYQFRCLVNGNESNWFTLKFTNAWTGSASNAWENSTNWSCGVLPDENTDVVITSGTLIINSNVTVRSLTAQAGVNVTVQPGYVLTITH